MIHKIFFGIIGLLILSLFSHLPLFANPTNQYDSQAITKELEERAHLLDSYAQDFIFMGRSTKRMWFLFKKDGKSFYMFRSEYTDNGKRKIHISNMDGQYDCDYYPEERIAYRYPKKGSWDESNYDRAKAWHFDYKGFNVVGEKIIRGMDCYVLQKDDTTITVWKEKGLKTTQRFNGQSFPLEFGNFEFSLDPKLFSLPADIKVVDRKEGTQK